MKISTTNLPTVLLVEPQVFVDERGFFMEAYHSLKMGAGGIASDFVQDNHSGSKRGTLRGLHYQIRQAQGKLVRVISGEIYDVAVDIRRGSPSFAQWVGVNLSSQNRLQLWIPPGFAHGFYVLSDWAEVIYKVTDFYAPQWERTIIWNDPELDIEWPLRDGEVPLISPKDAQGKLLEQAELFE